MGKDIQELADSMIARFDQQYGLICSQGKEQAVQAKHISAQIGEIGTQLKDVVKKVDENSKQLQGMEKRLGEVEKTNVEFHNLLVKELNEIELKRPNVVLFGVPEKALSEDAKVVENLLEVVAERKVAFEVQFRIGPKVDGKVRPIVARLHEEKDKVMLLKGANKLKDHDQFKGMYIKPDLTKAQRGFMKKQEEGLRNEAACKNSLLKNGENWEWRVRGRGMERHLAKVHTPNH